MDSYKRLLDKLESFIRRYYWNDLIKGGILFFSIGLLYFILTLLLEHFLWLGSLGRSLLFWIFVMVELSLLVHFILIPLLKLAKLSKGLGYPEAAKIIGSHFPQVSDKLLNVLQLGGDSAKTELLMASIDQKSMELQPVPFRAAVDFRVNLKYMRFAIIPLMIVGIVILTGNSSLFADSYTRVVNYKTAYEPPAPFSFLVLNSPLRVEENKAFKLQVSTVGSLVPENAMLHFKGQSYYLTEVSPGVFEFVFEPLDESFNFNLSANGVVSRDYEIEVVKVPRMLDFKMSLDYPEYTKLEDEVLSGSGDATIPEGTRVNWELETEATEEVHFMESDSTEAFSGTSGIYTYSRSVYDRLDYKVSTSNSDVTDYEQLEYVLEVVKDQYPELELESRRDSIDNQSLYFFGKVSDDYEVSGLELVYYSRDNPEELKSKKIPISKGSYAEFLASFPDTLQLERGVDYELYFQVTDNDGLRNGKVVKSSVFDYRSRTEEEIIEEKLLQQGEAIRGLDESLEKMELSKEELEELSRLQKESGQLGYNERRKLDNFLQRQNQQNELMMNYTEQLKKSLEEVGQVEDSKLGEELRKRIERKEERLEENEELLEELRNYTEKIAGEELAKKLEELSKRNQNQEKSLEQLLELTKRYYVKEKSAKISRDLEELGEDQIRLSEEAEGNSEEVQDSLSKEFQGVKRDLEELERENEDLKKPTNLGTDEQLENSIEEEQKNAKENLERGEKPKARENQQKAGEEMKKLAAKMKKEQQMAAAAQMQEDADMLRQILDNLLVFSFEQEGLLKDFQGMERNSPQFSQKLRRQNLLRENFEHVDDSLYSLALRNPMISEKITERLTDISYDLNKALQRLAQNEVMQGIGSQQYVITGANDLAYLLDDIVDNMQDMLLPSVSEGGEREQQLPDQIKKQGEVNEEMQEGTKKRKGGEGLERSEEENGTLFEIYQRQRRIRQALEEELKKNGMGGAGDELKEEMQNIEEELLEEGFNENTLKRMQELEHRLLDLEDAEIQEGQKEERESERSEEEFGNPPSNHILRAKEYFNTTEILNRQTLPLRQIYKQKVREYFERGDD